MIHGYAGLPQRREMFEKVITVNGKTELVRVVVDSDDHNHVITIFPKKGGRLPP